MLFQIKCSIDAIANIANALSGKQITAYVDFVDALSNPCTVQIVIPSTMVSQTPEEMHQILQDLEGVSEVTQVQ